MTNDDAVYREMLNLLGRYPLFAMKARQSTEGFAYVLQNMFSGRWELRMKGVNGPACLDPIQWAAIFTRL